MKRRDFIKTSALIAAAAGTSGILKASAVPDAWQPEEPTDERLIVSAPMLQNYADTSMGVVFAVSALADGHFPTVIEGIVRDGQLEITVHNLLTDAVQDRFTFSPRP